MVLPPLNETISAVDDDGIDANSAVYSITTNYEKGDRSKFTYYNAALEIGFATWNPLFVKGVVVINCDQSKPTLTVDVLEATSRFGTDATSKIRSRTELIPPSPETIINYFGEFHPFLEGDEVIIKVSAVDEGGGIHGFVIGFIKNPTKPSVIPWYTVSVRTRLVITSGSNVGEVVTHITHPVELNVPILVSKSVLDDNCTGGAGPVYLRQDKLITNAQDFGASGFVIIGNGLRFELESTVSVTKGSWTETHWRKVVDDTIVDDGSGCYISPRTTFGVGRVVTARSTVLFPGLGKIVTVDSVGHNNPVLNEGIRLEFLDPTHAVNFIDKDNYSLVWSHFRFVVESQEVLDGGEIRYQVRQVESTITETHSPTGCTNEISVVVGGLFPVVYAKGVNLQLDDRATIVTVNGSGGSEDPNKVFGSGVIAFTFTEPVQTAFTGVDLLVVSALKEITFSTITQQVVVI